MLDKTQDPEKQMSWDKHITHKSLLFLNATIYYLYSLIDYSTVNNIYYYYTDMSAGCTNSPSNVHTDAVLEWQSDSPCSLALLPQLAL